MSDIVLQSHDGAVAYVDFGRSTKPIPTIAFRFNRNLEKLRERITLNTGIYLRRAPNNDAYLVLGSMRACPQDILERAKPNDADEVRGYIALYGRHLLELSCPIPQYSDALIVEAYSGAPYWQVILQTPQEALLVKMELPRSLIIQILPVDHYTFPQG